MLKSYFKPNQIEAGCDEAGRGCLAGPVVAASVILPPKYKNKDLDDSKKLNEKQRFALREVIIKDAIAWEWALVDNVEIDKINILKASFLAMHRAVDKLKVRPEFLLIDGNRFTPYPDINHTCVIKGDGKYLSIAAASVIAKTFRDDLMNEYHQKYPHYSWDKNMGYPTKAHRDAIAKHGPCDLHRMTFTLLPSQLTLDL